MRLALVQCPPWGSLPPLGLASLKAYVEQHGHQATCLDLNIEYARDRHSDALDDKDGSVYARPDPFASESYGEWDFTFDGEVRFASGLRDRPLPVEDWADRILRSGPQVVGFSVQASNLGTTLQVAQCVARLDPAIPLVFGGPNVAQAQQGELALRTGVPDLVVEGEGEETLLEILDALEAGGDPGDVPGIGRLIDGHPVWSNQRPLMSDIDGLPFPDFTDFDWSQYPNPFEIPVMTSRGCVLNCAFCYETVYWKRFRTQSASRIVAEIKHQLASHPLRGEVRGEHDFNIAFADSLVNGHLGGLKRMAELLIEDDIDIVWGGQATINTKMDDKYLATLRASGCGYLSFGLESGSQPVLEAMGKRFHIAEARDFLGRVQRADIRLTVNIMVGFPTETRRDFLETLRFLGKIRGLVYMVNNVGAVGVTGGSGIHRAPEDYGMTPVDVSGWQSGHNFAWASKAAGTERERQLRLKLLHLWMSLVRIPHQSLPAGSLGLRWARLGPTSRRRKKLQASWQDQPSDRDPTMSAIRSRARIKRLTRASGAEPLLLMASNGVVDHVISAPTWSTALGHQTWDGVSLTDVRAQIAASFPDGVRISTIHGNDGVVDVTISAIGPPLGDLAGLRLYLLPPPKGTHAQMMAFFPLAASPSSMAAGVPVSLRGPS